MPDNEAANPGGRQLQPIRGGTVREEFGAMESAQFRETSAAAVAARERAIVEAEYIMAERHPRNWMDVRAAMLDHCARPRFAEATRYQRKVGSKLVNGEWVDEIARGFTVRFAQTLAQEMRNLKPFALVTFEDDLIRIVRFGVVDLERNLPRSREVAIAKTVERRGKKRKGTVNEYDPPEGRETIAVRLNSEGIPTYTVRATPEELRAKINAEESRTLRDFILRLCLPDILDDCEDKIYATMGAEDQRDPKAAVKRLLDRFAEYSVRPSDLETYIGRSYQQWTVADIKELRELGAAIRDNQTTFQDALRMRYAKADTSDEAPAEHDARLRAQIAQQGPPEAAAEVAEQKIAAMRGSMTSSEAMAPIEVEGELPPDPMSMSSADVQIHWRGKVWRQNEKRTGWIKSEETVVAEIPQAPKSPKPRFGEKA